ncbi:DNA excision repair protein ERCC-3 [Krasilnikovia cinnamomea]|uniref:DNA 3'-5' helicase n=1 Tax=Krasilnikovia cinnamomea TaxID=349313 RepID=A0A4Q7ZL51_9ACTN|nr:DNA excision repair protein ERCC-3 [Krasilnikovia cinnamomea]
MPPLASRTRSSAVATPGVIRPGLKLCTRGQAVAGRVRLEGHRWIVEGHVVSGGPLIVQSDKTLLLEVDHPDAQACRMAIAPFAELERSPEHVHTYRLTPLGLWNARAAGHDAESVVDGLIKFSRYPVPHALLVDVAETMDRYGRLQLLNDPVHGLVLRGLDRIVLVEVAKSKKLAGMLGARLDDETIAVHGSERGRLKQALLKLGWPAEDLAGYVDGEAHQIDLAEDGWHLRSYQQEAVDGFWAGGSGVVVLPCGAGKTLVGAAAMAVAKATTLILVTNTVAGRQWKRELIARTSLTEEEVGEYSGERKEIRPVTIATYQVLTSRRGGAFTHLDLFGARDWGLVIYDEVHLLPAPIFRFTADLQARRRLGLTATLVREDGREGDVFSLIGPKRYDAPWKDIEAQGWIAPAECVEVRVTLTDAERMAYAVSEAEERYRVASTARTKLPVVRALLERHKGEQTLVIGGYLDQLHELSEYLDAPIVQGATTNKERERLFDEFRSGALRTLVVSKVGNFSIDLPEAAVAIQVSGTFGSRQEEAQRLGRVLRPKADGRQAHFYTVVSRDTIDTEYAAHRQRFLAEQGYAYTIVDADDVLGPPLPTVD